MLNAIKEQQREIQQQAAAIRNLKVQLKETQRTLQKVTMQREPVATALLAKK